MFSDVAEDGTQGADPQRTVTRNGNMMLAFLPRGEAHMAACLARYLVAIAREQNSKFLAADISR